MAGKAGAVRSGRGFVELFADDSPLVRGLRRAGRKLKAWGKSINQLGRKTIGLGLAIAGPIVASAKAFADFGDSLDKMSQRTGISVQALSELDHAANQSGTSLEAVEKGIRTMQRTLRSAERGLSTAGDALDDLGLSVQQLRELSPEDQFTAIADRIGAIEDPSKRAATAMDVFGSRQAELLPLFDNGAEGISNLREEARRYGIVMDQKTAKKAAKLKDAMGLLGRIMKFVFINVGAAVAPILIKLAMKAADVSKKILDWVKNNQGLIRSALKIGAIIVGVGIALVLLGTVIGAVGTIIGAFAGVLSLVGTAFSLVATLIGLLFSPIALVVGGLGLLAAWFLTSSDAGGKALGWLGEKFGGLKDDALKSFGGIKDALASGDFKLAAKILWLSLKVQFQKGIHALNKLWVGAKSFFMDVWDNAVFNLASIFLNAWAAVEKGWAKATNFLANSWSMFSSFVIKNWNSATAWLKKKWIQFKGFFSDDIDVEAEVRKVDREAQRKNNALQEEMDNKLAARESERKARLEEIEQTREGAQEELRAEQERRKESREAAFAKQLASTEGSLAQARKEWEDALEQAAKQRKETEEEDGDSLADRLADLFDSFGNLGLDGGAASAGTFNAFAIRGFGANSLAERTANATEETAKFAKQTVQAIKKGFNWGQ